MIARFFLCALAAAYLPCAAMTGSIDDEGIPIDPPPAPHGVAAAKPKSTAFATGLSLASTALPLILAGEISKSSGASSPLQRNVLPTLLLSGIFVGPSAGQFYAAAPWPAIGGIALRGAGAVIAILGAGAAVNHATCGADFGGSSSACGDHSDGISLMWLGFFTYLGGAVYSMVDAGIEANHYNDNLDPNGFGWSPTLVPASDGGLKPGAMAWMRF